MKNALKFIKSSPRLQNSSSSDIQLAHYKTEIHSFLTQREVHCYEERCDNTMGALCTEVPRFFF